MIQIEGFMEYEKEKKLLQQLKTAIRLERDLKRQILLISDFYNIVAYLNKLKVIDPMQEIGNLGVNIDHYYQQLEQEQIAYCDSFINNFDIINDITNKLMAIYQKYPLKKIEVTYCNPIDIKNGMELLYDFFASLGRDFYNLFLKINQEQRISFTSNIYEEGMTYNASYQNGEFIVLRKDSQDFDYEFLSSLAHEIGHCYEFEFARGNKKIYPLYLLAEVSALFIQKLFDFYNLDNYDYREKALHSMSVGQSILYERCLSNDFLNHALNNDLVTALDYPTGIFDVISNEKTLGYINYLNSNAIANFPPHLDNYLYVLSDIVANNFFRMYQLDKKEALRLFKQFLKNANTVPFKENMQKYGIDLNESEKIIKEIYVYQKKHRF